MLISFSMDNIGGNWESIEFRDLSEVVLSRIGEDYEIVDMLRYEGEIGKTLYVWVKVEGSGVAMMSLGVEEGSKDSADLPVDFPVSSSESELSEHDAVQVLLVSLFDVSDVEKVGDDGLRDALRKRAGCSDATVVELKSGVTEALDKAVT